MTMSTDALAHEKVEPFVNDISMPALVADRSVAPDKKSDDQELPFLNWGSEMELMPLEVGEAVGEVAIVD